MEFVYIVGNMEWKEKENVLERPNPMEKVLAMINGYSLKKHDVLDIAYWAFLGKEFAVF